MPNARSACGCLKWSFVGSADDLRVARQKHQKARAVAKAQTKPNHGQVGVCATCGTVLEYAGHVNVDLDVRVHREESGCAAAGVVYRAATKKDHVDYEREV